MQRLWWLFLTDRTNFNIKILVYIGVEMIDLAKAWKDQATTSLDQAMTRVGLAKAREGLAKARVGLAMTSVGLSKVRLGLPMTRAGLAKTRVGLSKARVWEQCFLDEVCCLAFLLLSQHPSGSSLVRKEKVWQCFDVMIWNYFASYWFQVILIANFAIIMSSFVIPGLFETNKLSFEENWLNGYSPENSEHLKCFALAAIQHFENLKNKVGKITKQQPCRKYLRIKEKLRE